MSNINSKKKAAQKSNKKTNFFTCDGCFGIYAVGTGIKAPKNNQKLRRVCRSCFNQYLGGSPMPSIASPALILQHGSYMTKGGAGILSNANAGILSDAAGGLISNKGGGVFPTGAGRLISDKSGGILSNANAGIISDKGSGLISNHSGKLVGNDGASLIGNDGAGFRRK